MTYTEWVLIGKTFVLARHLKQIEDNWSAESEPYRIELFTRRYNVLEEELIKRGYYKST